MPYDAGEIFASLTLDDSDYKKKLSNVADSSKDVFRKIAGYAAAYLSGKTLLNFASDGVQAFANLQTASWNFEQVFARIPSTAKKAEEEMRKTYKLSETTSKNLVSAAADQLQGFGFTAEKSLEFAVNIAKRGIDLASFKGGKQSDAVSAIVKSLTGETEGLKRFGIVVQQGSKSFQQMVENIKATTGVTELQARAQAIFNTVLEQSKNAEGDYLKEGSTIAQQQMDLAEATIRAKEAFGSFVAEGASPLMETWRRLLVGFANTEPALQRLEIRTAAASVAFIALAKAGILAKANLVFYNTIDSLTSGFNKAKIAAKSLAAAIGPVGVAIAGLTSLYIAYNYIAEKNQAYLDANIALANEDANVAKERLDKNEALISSQSEQMNRLEELAKYERLSNSEKEEAEKIVKSLTSAYSSLDVSIDSITGKIKIGADAWDKMNDAQKRVLKKDIVNSIASQSDEVTALALNARHDLRTILSSNGVAKLIGGVASSFGLEKESYKATNSDYQMEVDDILNLQSTKEKLSSFEKLRRKLVSEGEDESAEKIKRVIDALKKQIELEKKLSEVSGKVMDLKNGDKSASAITARSKSERAALSRLENQEWNYRMSEAESPEERISVLTNRINKIFSGMSGKYGSILEFENADRSKMSEKEIEALSKIIDLEKNIHSIRSQSIKAFDSDAMRLEKMFSDRERRIARSGIERELRNAEARGDEFGVSAIMNREYERAKWSANNLKMEYEKALEEAQNDGLLNEKEKQRLEEIKSELSASLSDIDYWKGKIDDKDDKIMNSANKTVGSWSSEVLNAMLAGGRNPQEEIAKNTKDQLRLTRELIDKSTATYGG